MKGHTYSLVLVTLLLATFIVISGATGSTSVTQAATVDQLYALSQVDIIVSPEMQARQFLPVNFNTSFVPFLTLQLTGSIAYSGNHNNTDYDLFVQNVDSTPPIWLAGDGNDVTPHWSPDGEKMVFASDRDGDFEIYLRLDNGDIRQLTHNTANDIHPSWSSDGQHILFSSNMNGSYFQIFTIHIDGTNLHQVTNVSGNNVLSPAYSPDGNRIAFMRSSVLTPTCGWNWDIWTMNADGSSQQRVTTQLGADLYPSWSPDGQFILYAECGVFDLDFDLHRANTITGQTQYVMGSFLTNEWGGVYSPNNQYIAYSQKVSGPADIHIYSLAQGTVVANLSDNPADDLAPHWRGQAATDLCSGTNFSRQAVMLVTGWSGSYQENSNELGEDEQLHFFRNWLGSYGYSEGCNLFYAANTSPYEFLEANGQIIHQQLCQAANTITQKNPNWNGRFDIIAHSYGGLRSRALIEGDTYDDACQTEYWDKRIYVDHLYTLGTPHGGEWPTLPFSAYILIGALTGGDGVQWPALVEMLPPVRAWQNFLQNQPETVACYHLLGGDARPQIVYLPSLLFITQIWPGILDSSHDMAVHQISAHDLLYYANNYSRVHYVQTPDLHGQVPDLMDPLGVLRSFVNPNATFMQEVSPFLLREQLGCPVVGRQNAQMSKNVLDMMSQQQQPQSMPSVANVELAVGVINDGQTINGQFDITNVEKTQLSLYWPVGDLELTLINPQGEPINPTTANNDSNVNFLKLDTGFGLMAAYQITSTLTGTWNYQIEADTSGQSVLYYLVGLPETQLAITGVLPEWQAYNTPIIVAARVTMNGTTPIAGGAVTAEIQRPSGQIDMLSLFDDGQHQDGLTNDGLFANTYTTTNQGGFYGVRYQVNGSYNAYVYQRSHTAVFAIGASTATLNSNVSEYPIDSNGDNLYEALQIQMGLTVNANGIFSLSGDLYAGNNFVAHTSVSRASLTTGSRNLTLRFDGQDIRQSKFDGPYTLRNVLLLDETDITLMLQATDNVYTTAAYLANQFGIPITYLPVVAKP